jgi:hypothetical protein
MNPAEENPEHYAAARDRIMQMIQDGEALQLLEAYYLHIQSCNYVMGVLTWAAYESDLNKDIKDFARNLLDDWSK